MEIDWLLPLGLFAHNVSKTLLKFCSIHSINQPKRWTLSNKVFFYFFLYSHQSPMLPWMSRTMLRQKESYYLSIIIYSIILVYPINPENSIEINIRCKFNANNGFKFLLEIVVEIENSQLHSLQQWNIRFYIRHRFQKYFEMWIQLLFRLYYLIFNISSIRNSWITYTFHSNDCNWIAKSIQSLENLNNFNRSQFHVEIWKWNFFSDSGN